MLRGALAALATNHGKEAIIGPVLARELGIRVRVAPIDTDRFGTLAGDVPRLSTALATVRAKARAALAAVPDAELALASEGTFGPRSGMPFVHENEELVILIHRTRPLEIVGRASARVSRHGSEVTTPAAARDVAERLRFPESGVIVIAVEDGHPAPNRGVVRDLRTLAEVRDVARDFIARYGSARIDPDRRAHRDPDRMHVIARAAEDLERRLAHLDPRSVVGHAPLGECSVCPTGVDERG